MVNTASAEDEEEIKSKSGEASGRGWSIVAPAEVDTKVGDRVGVTTFMVMRTSATGLSREEPWIAIRESSGGVWSKIPYIVTKSGVSARLRSPLVLGIKSPPLGNT